MKPFTVLGLSQKNLFCRYSYFILFLLSLKNLDYIIYVSYSEDQG
jgi:hypothetical protein